MGIRTKNTWGSPGSSLDQQRSDMWVVDLGASVSNPSRGFGTLYDALAQLNSPERTEGIRKDGLEIYATSLTFPDVGMNLEMFRQGNMPVNLPVADKALEGVRMMFRVDVPERGEVPQLVNLLECWRDLARIGRGFGTGRHAIPPLASATHQPTIRFDVRVMFLAGADRVAADTVFNSVSGSTVQLPLRGAFAVVLRKAWCASVLCSEVSYEGNGKALEVTCQVYPEYIETVPERPEGAALAEYFPIRRVA